MSEERKVECSMHSEAHPAFVCRYLVNSLRTGNPGGLVESQPLEEDRDLERGFEYGAFWIVNGGEWNGLTGGFAVIKLICSWCFERLCELNANRGRA